MTATAERTDMKERSIPREPAVPFGSREVLLRGPKVRYADVVLPGIDGPAKYRLRELKQAEIEEIATANAKAGDVVTGNKARYVACSLVSEDMVPYFPNPMTEYALLNSALNRHQMDALFAAVLELNGIGKEAREEMGKASGETGDSTA